MQVRNICVSGITNKMFSNTNRPSFNGKKDIPEDKFIPTTVISEDMAKPELMLEKVKKNKKNAKGTNELFEIVLTERAKELDLLRKQEEMENLKMELCLTYTSQQTSFLNENFPKARRDYFSRPVRKKISQINSRIEQYEDLREPDKGKIKILGKIAKALSKRASFNPNYTTSQGLSLIDFALNSDDDEIALLLIRHKNFKCPKSFIDYQSEERYTGLEKKAKSFIYRLFNF